MRRSTPHLIERKSKTTPFCIDTRVDGKRVRKFFETRSGAQAELQRIKTKVRREGDQALSIPDSLRIQAIEAAARLAPFGKTLTEAAEFLIRHLENSRRSIPIKQLVSEYLASKERKGCSIVQSNRSAAAFRGILRNFRRCPHPDSYA